MPGTPQPVTVSRFKQQPSKVVGWLNRSEIVLDGTLLETVKLRTDTSVQVFRGVLKGSRSQYLGWKGVIKFLEGNDAYVQSGPWQIRVPQNHLYPIVVR
jgi:hypothetical protein